MTTTTIISRPHKLPDRIITAIVSGAFKRTLPRPVTIITLPRRTH
jgi:hypothetical protein